MQAITIRLKMPHKNKEGEKRIAGSDELYRKLQKEDREKQRLFSSMSIAQQLAAKRICTHFTWRRSRASQLPAKSVHASHSPNHYHDITERS